MKSFLVLAIAVAGVVADIRHNISEVKTNRPTEDSHELRGAVVGDMAKRLASAEAVGEQAAVAASKSSSQVHHMKTLLAASSQKGLPWTTTTIPSQTVTVSAVTAGVGASVGRKADPVGPGPEVIAKFTASAQASAQRAHAHLDAAKAALEKTTQNADAIHAKGKKIEKTANTIGYLYSTPKPVPTTAPPQPTPKSGASSFSLALATLVVSGSAMM